MDSIVVVPFGVPNPLDDPAQVLALIEFRVEAKAAIYLIHTKTESLAYQLLALISQPYMAPFTIVNGDLSIWSTKMVHPGQSRHFSFLGQVKDTRQQFNQLGLAVVILNGPLPTFPIQVSQSFPLPTPD